MPAVVALTIFLFRNCDVAGRSIVDITGLKATEMIVTGVLIVPVLPEADGESLQADQNRQQSCDEKD